jgi:uncharacterized membrane protein YhfC
VVMLATGLLTGVFECGVAYLLARSRWLRHAPWSSALAFGLAFGCSEAAVLGAFAVLLLPLLDGLLSPEDMRQTIAAMGAWHEPLVLLLERVVAVPIHMLTCVLVIRAVQERRPALFWAAFGFKSAVDAVPVQHLPLPACEALWITAAVTAAVMLYRMDFARGTDEERQRAPAD